MTTVERAYPDMFASIHKELLSTLDAQRPEEEWRRIFDYGWRRDEEHIGYVLVEKGAWVGFLGLLFSEVSLAGSRQRLCNITSWVAKEDYRSDAASLLWPLRALRNHTITNLSGRPHVAEIFRRFGFECLEEATTVMRPPLASRALRTPRRVRVITDRDAIPEALDDRHRQIYEDHLPYAKQLVVESAVGHCLGVYTLGRRRGLRTARFKYIGEPSTFIYGLPALRAHLLGRHGAVIIECDSRLLAGVHVPASLNVQRTTPRMFLSSSLEAAAVPNLYSELILLNLH